MTAISPPVVLESGDHLTRAEFHRRYCLRPDIRRAELVQGVVYLASPVRATVHGEPHGAMTAWLVVYASRTPGVRCGSDSTVLLETDTEVQPDVCLFREPPPGPGAARITARGYIEGAPQLVVEIAASSASYDLHEKLRAYERAEVTEYVAWRTLDAALDWFRLHEGKYRIVTPDASGVIESTAFPGLRLNVAKLLAGDMAGVLAELNGPGGS
ncbi:MAG: Uma2 family endonuclease [Dehalococcoidia bacterium]